MANVKIPAAEYKERIAKAAKMVAQRGLDVLVVTSTESDYANVRYFSGLYTIWERTGVAISAGGEAAMLIGPEGLAYTQDYSHIKNIFKLRAYRESADPGYPEIDTDTFQDAFASIGVVGQKLRIGVASSLDTNMVIYLGLREQYPEAEIVACNDIMTDLRKHKSASEVACLREAYRVANIAIHECIKGIHPGMTETQVVGIAQHAIYMNGAESDGMPHYVFADKATRHALSRPFPENVIKKDSMVQLNISARIDGYSAAIGIPISMGKFTPEQRRHVEFGREAHMWVKGALKTGILASDIAKHYYGMYKAAGLEECFLYGPCHGLGMIEVESPWIESDSDYILQPNFTYQIDTFVLGADHGLRWEEGILLTDKGAELFTDPIGDIIELGF